MTDGLSEGTRPQAGPGPWRDGRVVLALASAALISALVSLALLAAVELVSREILGFWELEPELRWRLELTLSSVALVLVVLLVWWRWRQGQAARASASAPRIDWMVAVGGNQFEYAWLVGTFLLIVAISNVLFFMFDFELDFPWLVFLAPSVVAPVTSSYMGSRLRARHPALWAEIERRAALPRRRGLNAAMLFLTFVLFLLIIAGMLLPKLPLG